MFLSVVAELQPVAFLNGPTVGCVNAGEQAQQSGFPRTVFAEDHHFRTSIYSEVHAREHL